MSNAPTNTPRLAAASTEMMFCPYCGREQVSVGCCEACRGLFDPLSKQATQNAMGPWFVRNEDRPFQPGCSYETLLQLIGKGRVMPETVIRGPTTGQFWCRASLAPGVGHLFGRCHSCDFGVSPTDRVCPRCGASFAAPRERQDLGLGPIHALPSQPPNGTAQRPLSDATPARVRVSASPPRQQQPIRPASPRATLSHRPIEPARAVPGPTPTAKIASQVTRPASATAPDTAARTMRRRLDHLRMILLSIVIANIILIVLAVVVVAVFRSDIADLLGGGVEETQPSSDVLPAAPVVEPIRDAAPTDPVEPVSTE
ncbi:MAG: hypothetical protein KAS72_08640 [Phycisphaerales bacterium]|nr:hypothetical protein [Phycisphaerales bacterium]